jgi:hypothetical protein
MKLGQKIFVISLFLFIGLAFFTRSTLRGQTSAAVLPREVLRPQYGEEPHFPKDYVIGELGRGDATEESYWLARQIVASLAVGDGKVNRAVFPEQKRIAVVNKIRAVGARSWRVGGGRAEGSGGYSFLIRFLGRERSITGELYLQWEEPKPVVIEEPVAAKPEETPIEPETAASENAALEFNIPAVPAGPPTEAVAKTTVTPVATVLLTAVEEPRWRVDDILLEPSRSLTEGKYSPGGADMTPYERFF